MVTTPGQPADEPHVTFDSMLGWARNAAGLEAQERLIRRREYEKRRALIEAEEERQRRTRTQWAPKPISREEDARIKAEQSARYADAEMQQMADEMAANAAASQARARDVAFLAERGIKHKTSGNPARPSRTYDGQRLAYLKRLVKQGKFATVEEAEAKTPRREPVDPAAAAKARQRRGR